MRNLKIFIGIPNQGATQVEAYDNRLAWACHIGALGVASKLGVRELEGFKYNYPQGTELEFWWFTAGRLFTPKARELLCEQALAIGADYILMVDDDMLCPLDMFENLLKNDVDIVAPLAFTRNDPHYPVLYEKDEGVDPVSGHGYVLNRRIRNYPRDSLVEVDAVGFGAVLIKTWVLKKMKQPWFCLTSPNGEDINFCYRAIEEAGARVFMDTRVKLGHLGDPKVIDEAYVDRTILAGKDKEKVNGQFTGPLKRKSKQSKEEVCS